MKLVLVVSDAIDVRTRTTADQVVRSCSNAKGGPEPACAARLVPDRLSGREPQLVEAGGQHIPQLSLRAGLCLHPRALAITRMRSVLSGRSSHPNPSARPGHYAVGESMSLYRAGLKLAFFLPLGVAMPLSRESAVRFHRCELRFHSLLTK